MESTNTGFISDTILEMLHTLEQKLEGKLKENEKLRIELEQQKKSCEQQKEQIQKMQSQIQSLEEPDIIDLANVIHLEWEEEETLSAPSKIHFHQESPVSQDSWCQLVG